MSSRTRFVTALASLALLVLAVAGCGSSEGGEETAAAPDYETALTGSPPPLAKLHAEGDELLGGGLDAYERRIESLRGYPVVVNVWASWCGPCREEFPHLQRLSARFGKRVAFLGINSQDDEDAAATFLTSHPVPYPSYTDPGAEITDAIGAGRGLPDTAFYNRDGELAFLKVGEYDDEASLEADIRRYALGESG